MVGKSSGLRGLFCMVRAIVSRLGSSLTMRQNTRRRIYWNVGNLKNEMSGCVYAYTRFLLSWPAAVTSCRMRLHKKIFRPSSEEMLSREREEECWQRAEAGEEGR